MKEETKLLIQEFLDDVEKHNIKLREKPGSSFDDDTEPTFENFIKWITFK